MRRTKAILSTILAIFFLLSGIMFYPSVSSLLLIVAGTLIFPAHKWQRVLQYRLKVDNKIRVLAVIILFVLAAIISPETSTRNLSTASPEIGHTVLENKEGLNEDVKVDSVDPTETEQTSTKNNNEDGATHKLENDYLSNSSSINIQYIDVGQADAALVDCDGHYMLIDGGSKSDSSKLYAILKSQQITELDYIIASHAHEDHIGGLAGALNYATAKVTLSPVLSYDSEAFYDFKKYADLNGGGITVPSVGDEYNLGSARFVILGMNADAETNDSSIILRIEYGNTSFLFTGDCERAGEQNILATQTNLKSTVLKVSHHGSDSSTSYPFLREVMPEYAVISVGYDNEYGHPTDDVLSRLRDADVKVFRTDLQGTIKCSSDGYNVIFSTDKSVPYEDLLSPGTAYSKPTSGNQPMIDSQIGDTLNPQEAEVSEQYYVLNTNTKKFHYPTCSSVGQMKEKNRSEFTGTREQVISKGYSPCGRCNP